MQWVEVTKERKVHTYAELWHTSWSLLDKGQKIDSGSTHQFRARIIFTAFALEAYLNHLGERIFEPKNWAALERLNPKDKLGVIAEKIVITIDFGVRPWGIMKELFSFRNDIAHGKTVTLPESKIMPIDEYDEYLRSMAQTRWEKFCTRQNAERAREDVERMIRTLHEQSGVKDEHPFIGGSQMASLSFVSKG